MKLSSVFTAYVSVAVVSAYPGMDKALADIQARTDAGSSGASFELIGDLATTSDAQLSKVGASVKKIITGQETGQSSATYPGVPAKGSAACKADTCCIWQYISKDMAAKFKGKSGRCNSLARQAVRIGFHDCAGWSKTTGPNGGCDGSILLSNEMTRSANRGMEDIAAQMKTWYAAYKGYGVTMADLIQMGATTATVVCPLGPRVRSYVGRRDNASPAPDGLLPSPFESADTLIARFRAMTIEPNGLTALIGAHTTSQQQFVDPSRAGDPQDGSPGTWDVLYYKQTLDPNAPQRIFKFNSDINISKDPRTSAEFAAFAGAGGQDHWNEDYAREYVRLSLLGVSNINTLTECSKVLPAAVKSFTPADQSLLNSWLKTTKPDNTVSQYLENGDLLSGLSTLITSLFSFM